MLFLILQKLAVCICALHTCRILYLALSPHSAQTALLGHLLAFALWAGLEVLLIGFTFCSLRLFSFRLMVTVCSALSPGTWWRIQPPSSSPLTMRWRPQSTTAKLCESSQTRNTRRRTHEHLFRSHVKYPSLHFQTWTDTLPSWRSQERVRPQQQEEEKKL